MRRASRVALLSAFVVLTACDGTSPTAGPSPSVSIGAQEDDSPAGKEVWEGTWQDENTISGGGVVSRSDGNVRLVVESDGTVTGEGEATQVTEGSSGDYEIAIAGTRDEDAFRLDWTGPGGTINIVIPIEGTTAQGDGRVAAAGNVYRWEMDVDCLNCPS